MLPATTRIAARRLPHQPERPSHSETREPKVVAATVQHSARTWRPQDCPRFAAGQWCQPDSVACEYTDMALAHAQGTGRRGRRRIDHRGRPARRGRVQRRSRRRPSTKPPKQGAK
jgi:hypothetical protein